MIQLLNVQKKFQASILSFSEQRSLKGKGVGNMHRKDGAKCPPPFETGKKHWKLS